MCFRAANSEQARPDFEQLREKLEVRMTAFSHKRIIPYTPVYNQLVLYPKVVRSITVVNHTHEHKDALVSSQMLLSVATALWHENADIFHPPGSSTR